MAAEIEVKLVRMTDLGVDNRAFEAESQCPPRMESSTTREEAKETTRENVPALIGATPVFVVVREESGVVPLLNYNEGHRRLIIWLQRSTGLQ